MKTIIIQIGNSDDKLTQNEWHAFHAAVNGAVMLWSTTVHFAGAAPATAPWQNACWVVEVLPESVQSLKTQLLDCRKEFRQDSIAWTEGETAFITE